MHKSYTNALGAVTDQHATAASNTAVTITLPAAADKIHVLTRMSWSYSAAPTGGRLSVVVGSTTVYDIDITAAGPGPIGLGSDVNNLGLRGSDNQAMVITLAAGGSGVVGKLNVGTM